MTAQRTPQGSLPASRVRGEARQAKTVLLVASCAGSRCLALRRLHGTADASGPDTGHRRDSCGDALRAAVRDRPNAVLVSTACLGPCHRGSLAAIGWATATAAGRLDWAQPPLLLSMLDAENRAAAAADWIRHAAPNLDRLPDVFARPDTP